MNASRRTLAAALGLFALALGLRAYVASGSIIAKDAYDLTALAKAIDRDGWSAVSKRPPDAVTLHHPMQPAAIALVHRIVPDWMSAARIASVGFGALSVLAMFGFFRRILPPNQALAAGALAAVHYNLVRFSCDGRSEGAFLFFVAAALWAAANAFRLRPPGEEAPARARGLDAIWAVLSGLFCAGAYWTRPEGIGVAILIAIWAVADRLQRKEEPGLLRVALGGIVLAACVAAALPYILEIGGITQKRDLGSFLTASGVPPKKSPADAKPPPPAPRKPPTPIPAKPPPPVPTKPPLPAPAKPPLPAPTKPPPSAQALAAAAAEEGGDESRDLSFLLLLRSLWHPLWPFFLLGLGIGIARRIRGTADAQERRADELQWWVLCGYLAIAQLLLLSYGYFSQRHTSAMFPAALALAARGIFAAAAFLEARAPALRASLLLPLAGCAVLFGRAVEFQRLDKGFERDAGLWIRDRLGPGARILANNSRPVFYSGGTIVYFFKDDIGPAIRREADVVLMDEDDIRTRPLAPEKLLAAGYVLEKEFSIPGRKGREGRKIQIWIKKK